MPTSGRPEHIASFVDANLSSARFAEYLTDPRRAILTARHDGRIVGYAMLIRGDDRDVELSSCTCCRVIMAPEPLRH